MRISRINALNGQNYLLQKTNVKNSKMHVSPNTPSFTGIKNSIGMGVLGGVFGFAIAGPAGAWFGAGLGSGLGAGTEDADYDDGDIYDYDTYKTTGMTMQDYII